MGIASGFLVAFAYLKMFTACGSVKFDKWRSGQCETKLSTSNSMRLTRHTTKNGAVQETVSGKNIIVHELRMSRDVKHFNSSTDAMNVVHYQIETAHEHWAPSQQTEEIESGLWPHICITILCVVIWWMWIEHIDLYWIFYATWIVTTRVPCKFYTWINPHQNQFVLNRSLHRQFPARRYVRSKHTPQVKTVDLMVVHPWYWYMGGIVPSFCTLMIFLFVCRIGYRSNTRGGVRPPDSLRAGFGESPRTRWVYAFSAFAELDLLCCSYMLPTVVEWYLGLKS